METGTFGGEEDDDVLFDDMVDEYDEEDEAIDAVSITLISLRGIILLDYQWSPVMKIYYLVFVQI